MLNRNTTRRTFLAATTGGVAAGNLGFLSNLPSVSADDIKVQSKFVKFDESIEPLVRLIEESPREKLLEKVAERIGKGSSYREVLAALLLAGIRNVQPRPAVGFKFHCVLVVNSCHLASLSGPSQDRWLPIFWALDYFKSSQSAEARASGWRMQPVNESKVPNSLTSRKMFVDAMEKWDPEKADVATAGIVRHLGATEVFNLFARFAARDYRSIGHKAIYLANSWRTLQVIGWQHAEAVLRSLTFALLNHSGQSNPAKSDHDADRPWRQNAELIKAIPNNWLSGKTDDAVTKDLFATFRDESPKAAAKTAVEILSKKVSPQSIWDSVFVGAGELLMRQPGIIGLHGLTTANAMHYLWQNAASDSLRRQLLLQACSFNPMFRESAKRRGKLSDRSIADLAPGGKAKSGQAAIEEIVAEISKDRMQAAKKVNTFLSSGGSATDLVNAIRRLLFQKGRDAHDYKFSSAVLEDFSNLSPSWRNKFMALSVFNLKGTGHPDSSLVKRTRAAFKG